jgi:hypothetical protein
MQMSSNQTDLLAPDTAFLRQVLELLILVALASGSVLFILL